ncbi:Serine/threonine-protein kinase, partial [Saccharata proteae CBS 121410]
VPQPLADYAQAQEDEIQALNAIFMDDYEEVQTKGAWSKTSDRAFKLTVRAHSDSTISIVLSVRFTATYPKSPPLLSLEQANGIRPKAHKTIEKILKTKPKELAGEVMIYEIATTVQEILEDTAQAKEEDAALPSLEEERAVQEAAAEKLAKAQEKEELRKKEVEKAEEDRMLQLMVDEEMNRRKESKRRSKVVFAPPTSILSELANAPMSKVRNGPVTAVFTVQTTLSSDTATTVVVKRASVKTRNHEALLKKKVEALDELLAELKTLSHPNIVAVLDFNIDRKADGGDWSMSVLTEFAEKGSLADMFQITETFPPGKVRSWTIELLEALDFYHRNGVIHRKVHAGNVLFCRPSSADAVSVKLADGGFQDALHEIKEASRGGARAASARSAFWVPSELAQEGAGKASRKTDVWDLGIVFLQLLFGIDTPQTYSSPQMLMENLPLSDALEDMIRRVFKPDPKRRPSAFDLIPSEFLRNNVPVLTRDPSPDDLTLPPLSSSLPKHDRRMRRESSGYGPTFSRYANEWVEAGRLGKGGFGEVVKARNKLDNRIYAIKKIKQTSTSALTEVLSEVMLLSRLNHPYVVRYYAAWPEDDLSSYGDSESEEESAISTEDSVTDDGPDIEFEDDGPDIEFGRSDTGGLDFIEFADNSGEDASASEEESADEESDDSTEGKAPQPPPRLSRTPSTRKTRGVRQTLYIQMEYCERKTLRDLIRKGLYDDADEAWRLFRQILEGLAHIHSHGIIHRDLKPDNVFIDVANNPRIGDFGLATSGQYQIADKMTGSRISSMDGDMTRSIGTALYVAPELRSDVKGSYNDKVDMYSLGIIFFEMCYPLETAMERDDVIRKLREKEHSLPPTFQNSEKAVQGDIIMSLISHRPSERPTSTELLRSGKLPLQIEDETVRLALQGLSDPNSPYYHKMLSALFAQDSNKQVKDFAWDLGGANGSHISKSRDLILQSLVEEKLCAVFQRHGAVKTQRQLLFPRSAHYSEQNVVQLFDASGTLVQLPYDFTLPYARTIARHAPAAEKTFTIGHVYRDTFSGGAPRSNGEADFDIVSYNSLDLALKEAEVIKVMDEIIDEFPSLASAQICFHLNHADLLELIMVSCRISAPLRRSVKDILSKLNIHQWTWQKIRNDLRSPTIGVSSTSLDDLQKFDFRDTPEKAFAKIHSIFEGTEFDDKTHAVFAHMRTVISYLKAFNIHHKVYVSPLSSFNEKFYAGGLMFQCLYDTKRRDVLAAGGRYDRLIAEHRPKVPGQFTGCHAVGLNVGWDRIVSSMAKYQQKSSSSKPNFLKKPNPKEEEETSKQWAVRRCDVLVASFDSTTLRSAGVRLVGDLWAHDLSAELAVDAHSIEDLLGHYRDDSHCWVVIIKHDALNTGKPDLKVKSLLRKEADADIRSAELIAYLRQELRERDHREGTLTVARTPRLTRLNSGPDHHGHHHNHSASNGPGDQRRSNVQVLLAGHRSKKSNKWGIIESAQSRVHDLLSAYETNGPIAAVETKDEVLDLIRDTRLGDADSWRRVIQSVPLGERQYLQDVQQMLSQYAQAWREEGRQAEKRVAFVYNFRTGGMVMYDL